MALVGLVFLNLTGCGVTNSNDSILSPPSWIQAAWTTEYYGQVGGWTFTSSDVYAIFNNQLSVGLVQAAKLQGKEDLISEGTKTDTTYSFTIPAEQTANGETTTISMTYTFTKVDDNTITQTVSGLQQTLTKNTSF